MFGRLSGAIKNVLSKTHHIHVGKEGLSDEDIGHLINLSKNTNRKIVVHLYDDAPRETLGKLSVLGKELGNKFNYVQHNTKLHPEEVKSIDNTHEEEQSFFKSKYNWAKEHKGYLIATGIGASATTIGAPVMNRLLGNSGSHVVVVNTNSKKKEGR